MEETLAARDPTQPPPPPLQYYLEQPVERVQRYQALLKVGPASRLHKPGRWVWLSSRLTLPLGPQELIRNKARNRQNCALLEQAYAVVSALPQRAENKLHVSLMENYPGTLEALGEPIRQVRCGRGGGLALGAPWLGGQANPSPTPHRATSSCGRGHQVPGWPGRATTATSSSSATTW